MIGTNHIFSERSLHRRMAALHCSANVPIIIGPDIHFPFPLFWESPIHLALRIVPVALTQYLSHQRPKQTMQAAPMLITMLSDDGKKEPAALYSNNSISNMR